MAGAFERLGDARRTAVRDAAARVTRGGGAPGRRRWQCGQCCGPDSSVFRHSGHVIVDMAQMP